MLTIDGSFGEGGGQILRSALALSLVTGRPFRLENIRARRQKPGLLAQHLTAVRAAAAIGGAQVEGAALGLAVADISPRPGDAGPVRILHRHRRERHARAAGGAARAHDGQRAEPPDPVGRHAQPACSAV